MKLKPPDLWPTVGLSESELEDVRWLNASVTALAFMPEEVAAALELYRFAQSKPISRGVISVKAGVILEWRWFAIHETAMAIWFLRETLDLLAGKIRKCKLAAANFDWQLAQNAIDLFDKHFPNFEQVRHAIAHRPTMSHTREKNAPKDGKPYLGPRLLDGDVYETANKGVRYTLHMSDELVTQMVEVITAYWAAFRPVEKAYDQAGRLPD